MTAAECKAGAENVKNFRIVEERVKRFGEGGRVGGGGEEGKKGERVVYCVRV